MERIPGRTIAGIILMFSLVTLVNFYVFDRLTGLLWQNHPWISLVYGLALSFLIGAGFMLRSSTNKDIKLSFMTVTSIYALEFSALAFLLIFELINLLFTVSQFLSGLAIVSIVAAIAIVSIVNAQLISVRKINIDFPQNLRLAHLSDIHIGAIHGKKYLGKLVDITNAQNPDIIAITGDIVSGASEPVPGLFDHLARLKGRVFLVTGNHEFYEGPEAIMKTLPPNVEVLRDMRVQMSGYSIFGMDYGEEQGVVGSRNLDIKPNGPTIVLTHVPQFLKLPEQSIILAGHYHAGQIFPVNFVAPLVVKNLKGIHVKDGVTLHVSPGSATWGPPMRFGSRNEITILELGKK